MGEEELTQEALDAARRIYESSKAKSAKRIPEAEQGMTSTNLPPKHNPARDKVSHPLGILDESILKDATITSSHTIPRTRTNPSTKESSREASTESLQRLLHKEEEYEEEMRNIDSQTVEDEDEQIKIF